MGIGKSKRDWDELIGQRKSKTVLFERGEAWGEGKGLERRVEKLKRSKFEVKGEEGRGVVREVSLLSLEGMGSLVM